jgi:hypothetical protein
LLNIFYNIPNSYIYARIYDSNNRIYNFSSGSFEDFNEVNLYDYCVGGESSVEIGSEDISIFDTNDDGVYFCDFPESISPGTYLVYIFLFSVQPSVSDFNLSQGTFVWDGSTEVVPYTFEENVSTIKNIVDQIVVDIELSPRIGD